MRDLNLGQPDVVDGRRLGVIVDGGDRVVLQPARRRKERTYAELLGRRACSKLVVLAVEVVSGGLKRRGCSCLLARAKARCERPLLRKRIQQAWRLRCGALLSCTTACAVVSSMLELLGARGADGDTPAQHA